MSPVLLVGYQISGLIDGETAVGDDDRTGDVTRFIGSEVQNGRRLFFRSRVAALQGLGLAGDHGILHEFGRINALRLQFGDLGIDLFLGRFSQRRIGAGRADRVADDVVFGIVHRCGFRQTDDAVLACDIRLRGFLQQKPC